MQNFMCTCFHCILEKQGKLHHKTQCRFVYLLFWQENLVEHMGV